MVGASKKSTGFLSIIVMGVLAFILFSMASSPKETTRTMMEQDVPKPQSSTPKIVTLASVILPPPPTQTKIPATRQDLKIEPLHPKALPVAKLPVQITPLKGPSPTKKTVQEPPVKPMATPSAPEKDGRLLLRLLEVGKGPSIEIAWPSAAADRAHLYRLFTQCYGMKTALLDSINKFYTADSAPGENWQPNLDKFSSFMRQPTGQLSEPERQQIRRIKERHDLSGEASVRFFPRRVDAELLAGLRHHLDDGYKENSVIHAAYQITAGAVTIGKIQINGRNRTGHIRLNLSQKCGL